MRNPHRPSGIALLLLIALIAGSAVVAGAGVSAYKDGKLNAPTPSQTAVIQSSGAAAGPVGSLISQTILDVWNALATPQTAVAVGGLGVGLLARSETKNVKRVSQQKSKAISDLWQHVPDSVPDDAIDPQSLALAHTVVAAGKKHADAVHT